MLNIMVGLGVFPFFSVHASNKWVIVSSTQKEERDTEKRKGGKWKYNKESGEKSHF